ncbi:hypothetical protein BpHYR1_024631 [Brachionus plicatilis]|uniref:Uncharacterized protein n=1 Tax=Brachionus plicatilis TaxID=10195 RepID=A0A3M7SGR0_BRAPC|nr:hypothetical protein BpHYR1_024631 [Brachionus plicatilis]
MNFLFFAFSSLLYKLVLDKRLYCISLNTQLFLFSKFILNCYKNFLNEKNKIEKQQLICLDLCLYLLCSSYLEKSYELRHEKKQIEAFGSNKPRGSNVPDARSITRGDVDIEICLHKMINCFKSNRSKSAKKTIKEDESVNLPLIVSEISVHSENENNFKSEIKSIIKRFNLCFLKM